MKRTQDLAPSPSVASLPPADARYKWVALATVTLGTLMVFINQSIVLISLPDIFRGIDLNPLAPGNTGYMLWMLMGFMVVLAVLWSRWAGSATCSGGCVSSTLVLPCSPCFRSSWRSRG